MDAMHAPHMPHRVADPGHAGPLRASAAGLDARGREDLPWKAMGAPGAKGIAPGAEPAPADSEWQPL